MVRVLDEGNSTEVIYNSSNQDYDFMDKNRQMHTGEVKSSWSSMDTISHYFNQHFWRVLFHLCLIWMKSVFYEGRVLILNTVGDS